MKKYEKPALKIIGISNTEDIAVYVSSNINAANIIYNKNAVNVISF